MELRRLHPWDVSPAEAMAIQRHLAAQVVREGDPPDLRRACPERSRRACPERSRRACPERSRRVAGVDIAVDKERGRGIGAVVVLSYPELEVVEVAVEEAELRFPYVPGLLSFRETPVLRPAFERLSQPIDLLLVDGQGLAHPRRFGIACHLGLLLDVPAIGCAKSRLVGEHGPVGEEVGSRSDLVDGGEVIGSVLRTRAGVNPLYISIGHRIGLAEAQAWVLRCCRGYRLPEPTRLAHQAAGGHPPQVAVAAGEREQLPLL